MIVFRFDGSERLRQQLGVDTIDVKAAKAHGIAVCNLACLRRADRPLLVALQQKQRVGCASIVSILVNTARGGLVKEAHLVETLTGGHLAARLLALKNVVAAPHVAWLTRKTLERSIAAARGNAKRLCAGMPLADRIA